MTTGQTDTVETRSKLWALAEFAGLPARGFATLLRKFETLDGVYSAETAEIQEALDIDEEFARKISEAAERLPEAEAFIRRLPERGIEVVTMFDADYPQGFYELNDPPTLLFYRGTLPKAGERMITFVGCSEPDADGISVAVEFAKDIAEKGVSLVSGIHQGVNIVSLIGATGGRSDEKSVKPASTCYAVSASGLDAIHPAEYAALAEAIADQGAVISEYGPEVEASPENLVEANRLLVALSGAVVIGPVVSESVGTFDVAEACVEQGKILFVLVADQQERVDKAALEKLVTLGAIPINYPGDLDSIIKCLV